VTGLDRWLCDGVDSRWPVLPPVTLAVVEIGRRRRGSRTVAPAQVTGGNRTHHAVAAVRRGWR
jgi:hypothetical protein